MELLLPITTMNKKYVIDVLTTQSTGTGQLPGKINAATSLVPSIILLIHMITEHPIPNVCAESST